MDKLKTQLITILKLFMKNWVLVTYAITTTGTMKDVNNMQKL
jgi:hypothetical protein